MLLEFTVGNFLSFKEKKTFSLQAGNITEHKENVVAQGNYKVLRSAVIYGANSSGKSNFIKALDFMITTIRSSSKLNSTDKLGAKPFLLSTETDTEPSFFEVLFTVANVRFRYGFELDNDKIHSEWLYVLNENNKKENLYFIRNLSGIGVDDIFKEAQGLESKTRDNGLFLTLLDQFNNGLAKDIIINLDNITILSGINHKESAYLTDVLYGNNDFRDKINNFISKLNLGFNNLKIETNKNKEFNDRISTLHNKYNNKGSVISQVEFKMNEQESAGTNKLFDLSGYLIAGLNYGVQLFIDELDSKLHPILTQEIIKIFNNPETNPKNAQLIFTTHDTNLLGANLFRRDQIWFTEKDEFEATDMYSLLEFKDDEGNTIRKDRSFEKDYIRGRYGAIPYISNLLES
jgi:hypothetical protein